MHVSVRTLCISITIASTFITLLFLLRTRQSDDALIANSLIDAVFSTWQSESIATDLPHDERVSLAKFCASGPDVMALRRFVSTGFDHAAMMAAVACVNADESLREMTKQFSTTDFASIDAKSVLALLRRLGEMGYGENAAESIRSIIVAAVKDALPFERREFVDLGCGRSKVLAVACTQNDSQKQERFLFDKCHGVEYSQARFALAQELQLQLQQALRNASERRLADQLANSLDITRGDVRSVELASRLFPRVSVVYMYNTLFGPDLDGAIARLLARHARPGTRVMMHRFSESVWPATEFRVVQTFAAHELAWTGMHLLEVRHRQR